MAHLALAWVAKFPTTSTVILGATKPEQVLDNLKALDVLPKLTPEVLDKIDDILGNKPKPEVRTSLFFLPCGLKALTRLSVYMGTPCPRQVRKALSFQGRNETACNYRTVV